MPKFDLIDDRFGEPLPVPAAAKTTAMDVDQHEDRTFFRAASEDRSAELLRGTGKLSSSSHLNCLVFSATSGSTFGSSSRSIHPSE